MKFKEEPADLAVKARLWDATERELEGFARKYAAGHVKGERYSEIQKDVTYAAKAKGYKIGLVRELGDHVRRDKWDQPSCLAARRTFRQELGL